MQLLGTSHRVRVRGYNVDVEEGDYARDAVNWLKTVENNSEPSYFLCNNWGGKGGGAVRPEPGYPY